MTCVLCAGQLDVINNSGICRECPVIIHNLLDVRIEERWRPAVGQVDHIVSDRGRVARRARETLANPVTPLTPVRDFYRLMS